MKKLLLFLSICGLAQAAGVQKIDPVALLKQVESILLKHAERPTLSEWKDENDSKYKDRDTERDYDQLKKLQAQAPSNEIADFIAALLIDNDQVTDKQKKERMIDFAIYLATEIVQHRKVGQRDIRNHGKLGGEKTAAILQALQSAIEKPEKKAAREQKERERIETQRKEATFNLFKILEDMIHDQPAGDELKKIKALIDAGADINSFSRESPSLWSDRNKFRETNSGSPSIMFWGKFTPLMLAAYHNDPDVVKLLIEAGAKVNTQEQTYYGGTALPLAAMRTVARGKPGEKTLETIQLLCHYNADPNIVTKDGTTALHVAVNEVQPASIIKKLLECGADPSIKDNNQQDVFNYLRRIERSDFFKDFYINYANEIRETIKQFEQAKKEIFKAVRTPVEDYPMVGEESFPIPKEKGLRLEIAKYLFGEEEPEPEEKKKKSDAPGAVSEAAEMAKVD